MSIDGMQANWSSFSTLADGVYERVVPSLRDGYLGNLDWPELSGVLDEALTASALIREEAESAIEEREDFQRISELLLAAATVDAMLASDIAVLDLELRDYLRGASLAQAQLGEVEERLEVLTAANKLFGGGTMNAAGGQEIPPSDLLAEVNRVTASLVDSSVHCGGKLVGGLLAIAAGDHLTAVVRHADLLPRLNHAATQLISRSPRFCREHVRKLFALNVPDEVEWLYDQVGQVLEHLGLRPILVRVAAVPNAKERTQTAIISRPTLTGHDADRLVDELTHLERGYRTQTEWIERSAKWLRRGAGPLSHLIAPVAGPGVVAGIFLLGLTYDAYSLTDRLDARTLGPADLISGVVRLVEALPSPSA